MFPSKDNLTICFAHAAYQMQARFEQRKTGIKNFQVWAYDDLVKRIGEADIVVASGMWKNDLIPHASKLKFIQSISSGMDQYSKEQLGAKKVRLASAAGVNAKAVAEHAIALILAIFRRLPEARDNQHKKMWRGMIGDLAQREDELGGKTLLVVGMGRIGSHLAMLGKAFGMKVIGIQRRPETIANVDEVLPAERTDEVLAKSDFLLLLLPATPATDNFINAGRLAKMKPTAWLLNFGRGHLIKDDDLIAAVKAKKIAGALLDVFRQEPLPSEHPFWTTDGIIVLPHIGGPHPQRDRFVARLFVDNLGRFLDGAPLKEVVDRSAGY